MVLTVHLIVYKTVLEGMFKRGIPLYLLTNS